MSDVITLSGLRVRGHHGVFDFEREQGQDFVVDVVLELDLAPAAGSDDVTDTVHYGELAEALVAVVAGEPVNLIETLADRLVAVCLADARVAAATVTVHKPQAPIPHDFADVAVTHPRGRTGDPGGAVPRQQPRRPVRPPARRGGGPRASSVLIVSGVYETPPWGDTEQPSYLNAVVLVADLAAAPARLADAGPGLRGRPRAGCATRSAASGRGPSTST